MTGEHSSSALERLRGALAVLLAARTSRIEVRLGTARDLVSEVKWPSVGVGLVDFARWRCAVDFGDNGYLVKDGRRWNGASGKPLDGLPEPPTPMFLDPLMLVAMAEAATAAVSAGRRDVNGTACELLVASCDLDAAAAARPPIPIYPHLSPDPSAIPIAVSVMSDETVARIRWRTSYGGSKDPNATTTFEVDFLEFGVVTDIDWSHLPVLKPPMSSEEKYVERFGSPPSQARSESAIPAEPGEASPVRTPLEFGGDWEAEMLHTVIKNFTDEGVDLNDPHAVQKAKEELLRASTAMFDELAADDSSGQLREMFNAVLDAQRKLLERLEDTIRSEKPEKHQP